MTLRDRTPVIVMAQVYELRSGLRWRWCRLRDVVDVVPGVARIVGVDYHPSPEELVHDFAALVRPNRPPEGVAADTFRKKIFRFSADGEGLQGTEVPVGYEGPPYKPFALSIEAPYPESLFVVEGWVIDTLKAIRRGAVHAASFVSHERDEVLYTGSRPKGSDKNGIILERCPYRPEAPYPVA